MIGTICVFCLYISIGFLFRYLFNRFAIEADNEVGIILKFAAGLCPLLWPLVLLYLVIIVICEVISDKYDF